MPGFIVQQSGSVQLRYRLDSNLRQEWLVTKHGTTWTFHGDRNAAEQKYNHLTAVTANQGDHV